MAAGVSGLTRGTLRSAPSVCRECVWWQSRGNKTASKERWIDRAEEDWGEWGTIYLDEGGRLLGTLQYGPSHLFPRAADLPAGPPSDDAVLVTCTYLVGEGAEWVEKSLLLAAIGESRDHGARALEAFAYRYPPGESVEERFLVHRTVFPRDFLDEYASIQHAEITGADRGVRFRCKPGNGLADIAVVVHDLRDSESLDQEVVSVLNRSVTNLAVEWQAEP